MARPQKIGLDYFPFDVDFFADRKIKVLFARFGCEGAAFYLYILCEIYRDKGFFVQCDDEFLEVASAELQIPRETLIKLLDFMVERQLIHGGLLRDKGVLTSRGIQARYQRAKENAGRKTPMPVRKELWLLNERETSAFIQLRGEEFSPEEAKRKTAGKRANKPRSLGQEKILRNEGCQGDAGNSVFEGFDEIRERAGEKLPWPEERPAGGTHLKEAAAVAENPFQSKSGLEEPLGAARAGSKTGGPGADSGEGLRRAQEAGVVEATLDQKMSARGGACISVENSGGNNPQRKGKKSKIKERGEGALQQDSSRKYESAPSSFGSGAAKTSEVYGEDGLQQSENPRCESGSSGFGGGAAKTSEACGEDGFQPSENRRYESGSSGFGICAEGGHTQDTSRRSEGGSRDAEGQGRVQDEDAGNRKEALWGENGEACASVTGRIEAEDETLTAVRMVEEAFVSLPRYFRREIEGFVKKGAPESLIRYAVEEAVRLGKPYSYMAAIVRQRLAEGRLDVVSERRVQPSYDLEAFEKLGFHVPQVPEEDGGKSDGPD